MFLVLIILVATKIQEEGNFNHEFAGGKFTNAEN